MTFINKWETLVSSKYNHKPECAVWAALLAALVTKYALLLILL